MSTGTSRLLRSDATQNRNRILEVARELFAAHGLDVQMATIARRAGVGVATLYRRFPTKEALVSEVFADQFETCLGTLHAALADPDPWHGLCVAVEKICAMQAVDRGFSTAFLTAFPDAFDVDRQRNRAIRGIVELVDRAKEAGQLREDFVPEDLTLLLMANSGIVAATPEAAQAASRRLVAYLLNSFRAGQSEPLPPPAPLDLRDVLG
jgi:AcrR family transcriptional regulator